MIIDKIHEIPIRYKKNISIFYTANVRLLAEFEK